MRNLRRRISSSRNAGDSENIAKTCDFLLAKDAYEETLLRVGGALRGMPRVPQLLSRNHILIEIIYRIQNGVSCKDCLVAYGSNLIATSSETKEQNLVRSDGERCHMGASEE